METACLYFAEWQPNVEPAAVVESMKEHVNNVPIQSFTLSVDSNAAEICQVFQITEFPFFVQLQEDTVTRSGPLKKIIPDLSGKIFLIPASSQSCNDEFQQAMAAYENGEYFETLTRLHRVISTDPENKAALFNMASVLHMLQLPTLAIHYVEDLLEISPDDMTAQSFLWALANSNEAKFAGIAAYRRLAQKDIRAAHKLATLTGEGSLAASGNATYVKTIYDDMADRFESRLVQCLGYRGPWILRNLAINALQKHAVSCVCTSPFRILDLGCGSGLVGRVFQRFVSSTAHELPMPEANGTLPIPLTDHLYSDNQVLKFEPSDSNSVDMLEILIAQSSPSIIGVDVSENIAQVALKNGGYANVVVGDLRDILAHCSVILKESPSKRFDIIIAADTFIYVGQLGDVFSAAAACLTDSGLFLFSVEDLSTSPMKTQINYGEQRSEVSDFFGNEPAGAVPGWGAQLLTSARFAHSTEYIALLASRFGFEILTMEIHPLRLEGSIPLNGLFYVLKR